jgi:hypothetical protein
LQIFCSIASAACGGTPGHPPSEQDVNGVLAAVHGIRANDEIEAMLAVQMVATHFAATRALRRLKGSDTVPQQDSNGNIAVKLLRTFAAQTEALQRYRGKGQQKMTVEHVHACIPAGRPQSVWLRHRGRGSAEIRGSTPWEANSQCTSALAAERKRGEGRLVSARRCRTGAAGYTAGRRRSRRRVTGMPSSMASTQPR